MHNGRKGWRRYIPTIPGRTVDSHKAVGNRKAPWQGSAWAMQLEQQTDLSLIEEASRYTSLDEYQSKCLRLQQDKRHEVALQLYTQAEEKWPSNVTLKIYVARCLDAMAAVNNKHLFAAREKIDCAIALCGQEKTGYEYYKASMCKARILQKQKLHAEAIKIYEALIAIRPNKHGAYHSKIICMQEMGVNDVGIVRNSIEFAKVAIALFSRDQEAVSQLGGALYCSEKILETKSEKLEDVRSLPSDRGVRVQTYMGDGRPVSSEVHGEPQGCIKHISWQRDRRTPSYREVVRPLLFGAGHGNGHNGVNGFYGDERSALISTNGLTSPVASVGTTMDSVVQPGKVQERLVHTAALPADGAAGDMLQRGFYNSEATITPVSVVEPMQFGPMIVCFNQKGDVMKQLRCNLIAMAIQLHRR